ncbi:uncharacterized protein [Palaemon carinicauda]|uniref:uncharacterized protein n=1 Tax=Palaemon carinicauda TaxID=392227 RepID=UPI0035B6027A
MTLSTNATGIQHPTGIGGRLIVLHEGSVNSIVPNAELVFNAKNDGDYHNQMNGAVFKTWFEEQLIPNPPSLAIVMDNASYHSVKLDSPPTMSSKKEVMQDWLIKKGLSAGNMVIHELMKVVKSVMHNSDHKFVINKIAIDNANWINAVCNAEKLEWEDAKHIVSTHNLIDFFVINLESSDIDDSTEESDEDY